MELFLQSIVNGLIQGGFFALFAVGLVLIFGVMGVVNFAHGELVMVGAFTIWVLHAQYGLPYIPAIAAALGQGTGDIRAVGDHEQAFVVGQDAGDIGGGAAGIHHQGVAVVDLLRRQACDSVLGLGVLAFRLGLCFVLQLRMDPVPTGFRTITNDAVQSRWRGV